jgi:Ca2+-binding RTX toxin-like protein
VIDYMGGEGDDEIYGGSESDYLLGEGGNDILIGEDGDDFLFGNVGNNTLVGGAGNDEFWGGEGSSIYIPGSGDDRIYLYEVVDNHAQGLNDGFVDTIVFEKAKKGNLGHDSIIAFEDGADVIHLKGYSQEDIINPVEYQEVYNGESWSWDATIDLNDGTRVGVGGVSVNDPSFDMGSDSQGSPHFIR